MWNPTVVSVTFEHLSEAKKFETYLDMRMIRDGSTCEYNRMGRRVQVRADSNDVVFQGILNRVMQTDFLRFTVTNPRSMSA